MPQSKRVTKKHAVKLGRNIKVYIKSTFNNTIITLTDAEGRVIAWSTPGRMKYRGNKKNTPYAAQQAALSCIKAAYDLGAREAKVYVKGIGLGREPALRAIGNVVNVKKIIDITQLPHNGCRPPKVRKP